MFGNRVLGRVFGPKRDEVTGEWRKLHNEDGSSGSGKGWRLDGVGSG